MSCQEAAAKIAPLVQCQEAARDIDAVSTAILASLEDGATVVLTAEQIVGRINVARAGVEAAMIAMRAALGVEAEPQISALRAQIEAATTLAEVSISISRSPQAFVVELQQSSRALVFARFGDLTRYLDFVDLNPGLPSLNFLEPGQQVIIPRPEA